MGLSRFEPSDSFPFPFPFPSTPSTRRRLPPVDEPSRPGELDRLPGKLLLPPPGEVARLANIAEPTFNPFVDELGAGDPVRDEGRDGFLEEWLDRLRVDFGFGFVVEGVEVVESSEEDSPCFV